MKATIESLAKHKLISVEIDAPIADAYHLMRQHKIRHLIVVDENQCIGIISDRDVQRATRTEISEQDGLKEISFNLDDGVTVRDFVSWPVKTVEATTSIQEVTRRMIREKISAFLIRESDAVTGIVTHEDLLVYLDTLLDQSRDGSSFLDKVKSLTAQSPIGELMQGLSNSGI